jgi:hypothetical protein
LRTARVQQTLAFFLEAIQAILAGDNRAYLRSTKRESHPFFYAFQSQPYHDQPINAQRDAASIGHSAFHRAQEPTEFRQFRFTLDRTKLVGATVSQSKFLGIGEFMVAIRQFHTSYE